MINAPNGRLKSLTLVRLSEPGTSQLVEPGPEDFFTIYSPDISPEKWRADAMTSQSWDYSTQITSTPIVDGSNLADHAFNNPVTFSCSVVLTDHPILPFQQTFGGESRSRQLLDQLRGMQRDRAVLLVATSVDMIPQAMITAINVTRTGETGMAEEANITIQEIRIARVTYVDSIDDVQAQLGRGVHGSTITTILGGT